MLGEQVPHTGIPAMIRAQRAALDARIRGLSQSHVVHLGLPLSHFQRADLEDLNIAGIPGAPMLPFVHGREHRARTATLPLKHLATSSH